MKPFFFFLCFLFLFGCEKATKYNSSPRDNFEALWRIMDENYCFFAFKDVDWDDVYDRYNLLVKDTMNQYELFDILGKNACRGERRTYQSDLFFRYVPLLGLV